MAPTAEYLVVDSGGFIKNDLGSLHAMADNIVTLHEVTLITQDMILISTKAVNEASLREVSQSPEKAPTKDRVCKV